MTTSERRRHPRFPVSDLSATVDGQPVDVAVVSATGLLVVSEVGVDLGRVVELELPLDRGTLAMRATVVFEGPDGDSVPERPLHRVGLSLGPSNEAAATLIAGFIERQGLVPADDL